MTDISVTFDYPQKGKIQIQAKSTDKLCDVIQKYIEKVNLEHSEALIYLAEAQKFLYNEQGTIEQLFPGKSAISMIVSDLMIHSQLQREVGNQFLNQAKVIFSCEGEEKIIECEITDKLSDIFKKYGDAVGLPYQEMTFVSKGTIFKSDEEISYDRICRTNTMVVNVYKDMKI